MKDSEPKRIKTPWPTKDAMEQIYALKLWGDNKTAFYSGEGSHHPEIVAPYVETVASFLKSFEKPLVVCDLGCGDFNVGKQLLPFARYYFGIDIVTDLIAYNTSNFKADNVEFQSLDIAKDDLPEGDCALIRQVLQHLSNTEIQAVLDKLTTYKYVVLTEHLPCGNFVPNKDIISGQGTRLKKQSGVNVLASPFHFKVKEVRELLSVVLDDGNGIIVTTVFTIF